jgi:5'-3' exonuclease
LSINKKVLVLDGYNLMFRARYSTKFRTDTSTIFNFFRSLRSLYEEFNPDVSYLVLEGKPIKRLEATKKLFGEVTYKAQRTYEDTDNFSNQRKVITEMLINYFPVKVVRHADFECDDICNYIANTLHKNDESIIISSDTDFIQSINENCKLYNPVRKAFIAKPEFDYITYKSLKGDKSDNIEGFKGIGEKTAVRLCNDEVKLNNLLSIKENLEKFNHNKFMIKFHDLEDSDIKGINYLSEGKQFNSEEVFKKFTEFDFKSIINKENYWNSFKNTFLRED